jgi:hypothetical protein
MGLQFSPEATWSAASYSVQGEAVLDVLDVAGLAELAGTQTLISP